MTIFYISDTHFNHRKMAEMRGYNSVEEMDYSIIEAWNLEVKADDVVYHLGDFAFGNREKVFGYFSRLNGNIHVLCNPWHHDKFFNIDLNKGRPFITNTDNIVTFEQPIVVRNTNFVQNEHRTPIVMCHYPMYIWDRKHYLSIHVHGHSHDYIDIPNAPLAINVCMKNDLYLVSEDDIISVAKRIIRIHDLKPLDKEDDNNENFI